MDIAQLNEKIKQESVFIDLLFSEIGKVIVGQKEMVERLVVGLLGNGHILLEGVPGLAKTLAIKTLAAAMKAKFQRIQFTPDLLPADLIGTQIYNQRDGNFFIRKGPIFSNFILADEINRAPAKVQSALLEAMQERQVTIGEQTFKLEEPFLVLATQNPIEQEGTYPLPEAQLDRFLMKIVLHYPGESEEREILARYGASSVAHDLESMGLARLAGGDTVVRFRQRVGQVRVEEGIVAYVQKLIAGTRRSPHLHLGASPRGGIALLKTSQCLAAVRGRDFVVPDDVKEMALAVLRHRVILRPEAELEGLTPDTVISQILDGIPVPR